MGSLVVVDNREESSNIYTDRAPLRIIEAVGKLTARVFTEFWWLESYSCSPSQFIVLIPLISFIAFSIFSARLPTSQDESMTNVIFGFLTCLGSITCDRRGYEIDR